MRNIALILIVFYIVLLASCKFTSEEEYFDFTACDSTQVNRDSIEIYYSDLTYIFTNICQNCHNTGFTYMDGINFSGYDNTVKSFNTGKVIDAINHRTAKMPKDQPKLNPCEIQNITIWYERGMPQKANN